MYKNHIVTKWAASKQPVRGKKKKPDKKLSAHEAARLDSYIRGLNEAIKNYPIERAKKREAKKLEKQVEREKRLGRLTGKKAINPKNQQSGDKPSKKKIIFNPIRIIKK